MAELDFRPPLDDLLAHRDLILVTGKGGSGKSTVVAALAELAAQRRGSAVAVELSVHPRLPAVIDAGRGIQTLNLDAEEVVSDVLRRLLRLPALVGALLKNRIIRLFIRTSPAIREMILLDEIRHLVDHHSTEGRPVIVDLPASGHALSFLETPQAVQRMLRVGPLADVAERAARLLADPTRAELVVVALPEELPVNETIELMRRAAVLGIAGRMVVVNQVPSATVNPEDGPLLGLLGGQGDAALGRFVDAAQSDLASVVQAQHQVERLRLGVDAEVFEVPRNLAPNPRDRVRGMMATLSLNAPRG